jgi:hypothetical protein
MISYRNNILPLEAQLLYRREREMKDDRCSLTLDENDLYRSRPGATCKNNNQNGECRNRTQAHSS